VESSGPGSAKVGYWSAQEQYSMNELLGFAVEAEKGGFRTMMASDHFHPWFHTNGYGNFTWVWMAAAAERTKRMQFVTGITCPIFRYSPGIVAQAFASLDNLYPGRIGLGLGTGEAMNEVPNGFEWGTQMERLERTTEAIEIIQSLWDKKQEFISYRGKHYRTEKARLYTPPTGKIPLYMAATGKNSTRVVAKYCDGLITLVRDGFTDQLDDFKKAAAENGRGPDSLEIITEYKLSFSADYERALDSARRWKPTALKGVLMSQIHDPRELEETAAREVSDEMLKKSWHIMTSIDEATSAIERLFKAGVTKVYAHSSSPDEMTFLREFTRTVLPHFSE
jgi:coenzyme F420-dependent glucose-6-phosphate dehydrogenase